MRRLAAAAVVLAAVIASGGTATAKKHDDPCALLKRKEITAALDQPAGSGSADLSPLVCDWPLFPTSERAAGTVHALVERGAQAREDFAIATDLAADGGDVVRGLGRKALFTPALGVIYVLADRSTLYYIQALYPRESTPDDAVMRAALIELAEKAGARV